MLGKNYIYKNKKLHGINKNFNVPSTCIDFTCMRQGNDASTVALLDVPVQRAYQLRKVVILLFFKKKCYLGI